MTTLRGYLRNTVDCDSCMKSAYYERDYPLCFFSSLSAFEELSLHSILIKKKKAWFVSHQSLIKGSSYLNDCSLVRSSEERILGRGRLQIRGEQQQLNALCLCLYSPIMCLIKSERDVEGAGGARMLLQKIWLSFLSERACAHTDLQSKRNALFSRMISLMNTREKKH